LHHYSQLAAGQPAHDSIFMTLTLRLILLILAIVLAMLVSGAFVALDRARSNVSSEIDSNVRLTLQLLTAALISGHSDNPAQAQQILLDQLKGLDDIRHLHIAVIRGDGTALLPFSDKSITRDGSVPDWFVKLLAPVPAEYHRRIASPVLGKTDIVVVPNPYAAIRQVWLEVRSILGLVLFFTAVCLVLMTFTIRRALRPVNDISAGLGVIQSGDFAARLPPFRLPELDRLSHQFNHMAQVLEAQQAENHQLNKRLLAVQESERRHLARELHDELGQSISAIKVMAVNLRQNPAQSPEGANAIIGVCNQMYGVVRDMMNRLRPVALEELGPATALERLVDGWNDRQEETFCALNISGELSDLDEETAINLYRIVQEALTNVARHAGAGKVSVQIERLADGAIDLRIADDGRGFDADARPKGMGLLGMRERVQALQGKISLAARPGQGVSIAITLPFIAPEQDDT
jgi:two-component system, NarL family, sensor histidine kinase UhpB